MIIILSDSADKQYERLPAALRKVVEKQFVFLAHDIRHPSLHAKKYGEVAGLWQARIYKTKAPPYGGRFCFACRSWLVALDFCADFRDEAGCRILAAQAKGEAEGEAERYHHARKERLQYALRDLELRERCEDAEDPDRPSGCRACKSGCSDACCASRTRNHPLC